MINQRNYPKIYLGLTTSSVADFGCNLCSICQALIDRGYDFTPATLNTRFTNNKSYSSGNLISPSTIASTNSDIFISGTSEAWNDTNVRKYLSDKQYFVVCEVSAQGIGGTGQHFVLLRSLVEKSGVITNSYIGDPWGGLENLTSVRYGNYGYIKSLRVYKVKIKEEQTESTTMNEQAKKFFAKIKGNINADVNEDPQNWSQNDIDNVSNEINQAYKDKISLDDEKKKLEDQVKTLTSQLEKKTTDFGALQKSFLEEKQILVATAKDTLDKQAKDYEKKITDLKLTITQLQTNINTVEVEKDYTLKELLIKVWKQIWKRI